MYNERMNSLRMDILRDRGNTAMVVKHGIDWLVNNTNAIQVEEEEQIEKVKKTVVYVAGGAFDHLYECMLDGQPFDVEFLSDASLALLNPFLNEPFHEGETIRNQISPEWLEKTRKKYNRMVFTIR